jgi:hypothetical protein
MASITEHTFRKLRQELRRYPNLDLAGRIQLGQIGIFDSRHAEFDWQTNLGNLGLGNAFQMINNNEDLIEEMFTSGDDVSFEFSIDKHQIGKVTFEFASSFSIVAQSNNMNASSYDLVALQQHLLGAIAINPAIWNMDWVIVTKVYTSQSYTLLVSKSNGGKIVLETGVPLHGAVFDIADQNLNLQVTSQQKMAYRVVCQRNSDPFFMIHHFKRNKRSGALELKPFGTKVLPWPF